MAQTSNRKINWLKLSGVALLLHIALIAISFIEVFLYSMIISPGKDEAFYEAHAQITAPWVSGIFGALFMFLLVKRFIRHHNAQYLTYALALPGIYILMDILMLLPFNINWAEHFPVLLMANGAKVAASLIALYIYKGKKGLAA